MAPCRGCVGRFVLGVLESLGAGLISSEYKDALAFLILLMVLFLKPAASLGGESEESLRTLRERILMEKKTKLYLIGYAIVVFITPVFLGNNYHLMVLNVAAVNIIVVLGLNLLMGYGRADFPGTRRFLRAGGVSFRDPHDDLRVSTVADDSPFHPGHRGVAYAIGIPTLKLEGHYLVMATLGFNVIVYIVMIQFDRSPGGPRVFPGSLTSESRLCLQLGQEDVLPPLEHLHGGPSSFPESYPFPCGQGDGRAEPQRGRRHVFGDRHGEVQDRHLCDERHACFPGRKFLCALHHLYQSGTFSIFFSLQLVTMVLVGGMGSLWALFSGPAVDGLAGMAPRRQGIQRPDLRSCPDDCLVFFPEGSFRGSCRSWTSGSRLG